MSTNPIFPTNLTPRQAITFKDPAGVVPQYQVLLNPGKMPRSPSNMQKWQGTVNGGALIIGQGELPPKEIAFSWDQVDISDLQGIAAFTSVKPSIFIDNRDNGYLGALVLDAPEQIAGKLSDTWAVKGSFLVISPYDGLTKILNKLAVPALSVSLATSGGYIPASTTIYVWATVTTPSGESLPSGPTVITTGSGGSANYASLSWTVPTSKYYRKLSLYWNTVNNSSTATWLTDVWAGQTQTASIFTKYIQYSKKNPPTYTRAYTGQWQGGLWVPGV